LGSSAGASLKFSDENGNPISITNSEPIDIYLIKDSLPEDYVFNRINASQLYPVPSINNTFDSSDLNSSNMTNSTSVKRTKIHFMQNGLSVTTNNASVHIQLKPDNPEIAYLMVLKFNGTPDYNTTNINYDYLKVLCPDSGKYIKGSVKNYLT
jgi:hypothetical protein